MKTLVVVVLAAALAVAAAGPAPGPDPEPAPAAPGPQGPVNGGAAPVADQESQASEAVSKRGAARLSAVSGNSITDNTVSSAPQQQQQLQQQQPVSYSVQLQQQQQQQIQQIQQQQQPQQPLYAPHPYSFVAPQAPFFQYQPALQALPPLPMLHSKYHAPGKQVLQYLPQPYFQLPQFQAPLMYIIPQPQAHQAHPQHGSQGSQQHGGQHEQSAQQAQQAQPQQAAQPHYVMVLSAPAPVASPVAANGFQYFNHPQLALQPQQQLITFYAGPQQQQLQQQQQQQQQQQHLQQQHQHQPHHHPQTRFYPEQQQLVYQAQADHNDAPHFVPKNSQSPVGLEAPAPPGPSGTSYGARLQQQQPQPQHSQHAYKTIIKA